MTLSLKKFSIYWIKQYLTSTSRQKVDLTPIIAANFVLSCFLLSLHHGCIDLVVAFLAAPPPQASSRLLTWFSRRLMVACEANKSSLAIGKRPQAIL